ncbi:MAG: ATP-dependent zinc metalloprotease FtsH [Candidatus Omnitrophica bacterium]|nr:ATP-dependent zinc metalloprotease FtsH [Candidatus Omnitrophota bacterium]MBU0878462.1 ATP-dependent zinc metalloprotease FtsH [Candidatus Omnitrophota bacterium]
MEKESKEKKGFDFNFLRPAFFWIALFLGIIWLTSFFNTGGGLVKKLTYNEFYYLLEHNLEDSAIEEVKKTENLIQGKFTEKKGGGRFYLYIPQEDKEIISLLRDKVETFEVEPPRTFLASLFYSLGPMVLFILFLWYFSRKGNQMGSQVWSFGKSRAKIIEKEKSTKVTFRDVAGIDESKEELKEIIEFLKDPKRFQVLGGRIPKGVILVGPPGCGKTLLAKAVAGEADVTFFSISGSDFVELFIGVGASRVRDLFEQAKKVAKTSQRGCIIFIDEIDAVGRQRFAGIGGGHDEREQTLNQLLVEMDGFHTEVGVVLIAATNRPDVLDPALLRPGRFDRHIIIDAPDIKGREGILKVHTRKIKLAENVNLSVIAKQTPGFSGADLENLCNEAALLAARRNKEAVEIEELQEAMERVVAGPQRKSRVISKREKEIIAYHETGHSFLSLYLPNVDPLHKVSIIPRGVNALGYTMQLPTQDRYILSKSELLNRLCVLLGGRAAEEIILKEITTGAQNDLEVATKMARKMVTDFGMSERVGHITLGKKEGPVFLGRDLVEHRDYSEATARMIDEEVKRIIAEAYSRAKKILEENSEKLKSVAQHLLEKEVLDAEEVKEIIGLKDEKINPAPRSKEQDFTRGGVNVNDKDNSSKDRERGQSKEVIG